MEDKIFDMGKQKLPEWYGIVGSISFGGYLLY